MKSKAKQKIDKQRKENTVLLYKNIDHLIGKEIDVPLVAIKSIVQETMLFTLAGLGGLLSHTLQTVLKNNKELVLEVCMPTAKNVKQKELFYAVGSLKRHATAAVLIKTIAMFMHEELFIVTEIDHEHKTMVDKSLSNLLQATTDTLGALKQACGMLVGALQDKKDLYIEKGGKDDSFFDIASINMIDEVNRIDSILKTPNNEKQKTT